MNKKFSTFLCASLLITTAFTANATDLTNYANGAGAGAVAKLDAQALKGVYQLRSEDGLTTLVVKNGKYVMETVSTGLSSLPSSLWCIQVTEQGQGKEPIYDFVNKATGEILAIAEEDVKSLAPDGTSVPLSVGETFGGWAFARTYKTVLEQKQPMFTYMEADYVLILKVDGSGNLVAEKKLASAARDYAGALKFTAYDAGTYVLSASEINAYLKDNKDVLTFTPDANADVNPFSKNAFETKGLDVDADHNFVYVTSKSNENSYLKVDTAANGVGIQFLKFGWTDATKEEGKDITNSDLIEQHKFLFTYKPSTDKVFIQVKQARYKSEKNAEKYWNEIDGATKGTIYNYGDTYVGLTDADPLDVNPSKLFVKLQNFTVADRIATIGEQPINTSIGFGLTSCFIKSDKTSLANGLYIIKNAKGEVLAAPIHENADNGVNTVEWVKLDEQDPMHMPAYQWAVVKTQSTAASQETSPITFMNREYPGKTYSNVQLRIDADGNIVASESELSKRTFVQVTDSAIIKDKKLGYRYVSPNDLMVTKYKFNYLNPFTQDYWIANGSAKDSLIYVKADANEYSLVEGSTAKYGITVDEALLKKIPGLAQLERTNYVIAKDKINKLVEAYGSKYSMGIWNYNTTAVVDTFFFKENNHFNGKHYYAIVESNWNASKKVAEIEGVLATAKVGIADDGMTAGLKVQKLNETRTSSFTVEPADSPLYRRFTSALLEGNEGDATDTLRFFENYRNEYLQIEANKNFMKEGIDFLGIYTADKAPSGLSFIVDTAWVTRGAGYIKPQYLISIDRNDMAGITGEPCTEAGPHVDKDGHITTDPNKCVHAKPSVPGFQRGLYLINFHNFAANDSKELYQWKKYDRAGFVEAIVYMDTMYVLREDFKGIDNAKVDFAALKKAEVLAEAAAKKDGKTFVPHIYDLTGDNHKYVTWSMRFLNKDVAANEKEEDRSFLFESMKADADEADIAPQYAAWLKMQNGCLVLSDGSSSFDEMKTGGDDALIFNVKHVANDSIATDTEDINANNSVSVIAGKGIVTVMNATGKTVTIANVLGQVVAEAVLSSDNATITVPAGIVAVTVDGNTVKTIVK